MSASGMRRAPDRVAQPYTEIAPPADLAPYVDRFWWSTAVDGVAGRVHHVLPDGCVDVIVRPDRGEVELVGTMTRALVIPDEPAERVAVRFRPGTAAAVARCALAELTDRQAGLAELGVADDAVVGRVTDAAPGDRIAVLTAWLRARLVGARAPDPMVARGVALLSSGARVERVAGALGVTRQHLARAFGREVGVTPKQLARIARMQRAVAAIGRGTPLARLAGELGYFDQAHLGNELRALIGVTPAALVAAPPLALTHLYTPPVPFLQAAGRRPL